MLVLLLGVQIQLQVHVVLTTCLGTTQAVSDNIVCFEPSWTKDQETCVKLFHSI